VTGYAPSRARVSQTRGLRGFPKEINHLGAQPLAKSARPSKTARPFKDRKDRGTNPLIQAKAAKTALEKWFSEGGSGRCS